eukprot:jgi/Chrzof1/8052/UNPLg00097.t1
MSECHLHYRHMCSDDLAAVTRLHKFAHANGQPIFQQYGSDALAVLKAAANGQDHAFGLTCVMVDHGEEEVVGGLTAQSGEVINLTVDSNSGSAAVVLLLVILTALSL